MRGAWWSKVGLNPQLLQQDTRNRWSPWAALGGDPSPDGQMQTGPGSHHRQVDYLGHLGDLWSGCWAWNPLARGWKWSSQLHQVRVIPSHPVRKRVGVTKRLWNWMRASLAERESTWDPAFPDEQDVLDSRSYTGEGGPSPSQFLTPPRAALAHLHCWAVEGWRPGPDWC